MSKWNNTEHAPKAQYIGPKAPQCKYGHRFCEFHIGKRREEKCKKMGGIAVIIADVDDPKRILIAQQRGGADRGKYSVVQGKIDPQDNCCFKKAALRELAEEFKIHFDDADFLKYFTLNNYINYVNTIGTTIFIALVPSSQIDLSLINAEIATECLSTDEATWHLREVCDLKWHNITTLCTQSTTSRFANTVIKQYTHWLKKHI